MKVQILSRKFIKPSTPTPPNLRYYKISFADELAPTMNVALIVYYPAPNGDNGRANSVSRCHQLEKSLEQILTRFYPLAGRYIKESRVVDCNDQGVEYVVAQVDCPILQLLDQGKKRPEVLSQLIPCEIGAADEITDPLISVQVSLFKCGGLAIGGGCSHRIGDASTISLFIGGWASACRGESIEAIRTSFESSFIFPERKLSGLSLGIPRTMNNGVTSVFRRFWFNKKAISTLKAEATVPDTAKRQPSGLQSVNALIWRALVSIDEAKHGHSRTTFVIQPLNLRGKTVPPIPNHAFGNLWGLATTQCMAGECDHMEFQGFVKLLSDSVKNAVKDCAKILSDGEEGHMVIINPFMESNKNLSNLAEVNFCLFTSWCRFPFYEADFGWGKPIWASPGNMPLKNVAILMDDKDGDGIEAWVYLDEKDMAGFEQDCDIRAFAI